MPGNRSRRLCLWTFHFLRVGLAVALISVLTPRLCWGCACGCGIFDVQTNSMIPTGEGGTAYLEYDFMNQNRNWSGGSAAPAANNDDKQIRTSFWTAGAQYMLNRNWGVMGEVPYWGRFFKTTDDSGNIVGFDHSNFGDVRLRGIYSGFSPDMSTGITFGVKLPTGDYAYPNFDRDTAIGTGSTDILLGVFHTGRLSANNTWSWFSSAQLDAPVLITGDYRPGGEIDAIAGVYYEGWTLGNLRIVPLAQAIGSGRLRDAGSQSASPDSGYGRLLLAPGIEVHAGNLKVNADVGFPVVQSANGNQLVAAQLYRVSVSHGF